MRHGGFKTIGLIVLVIGILLFILGGQIQVNASETWDRVEESTSRIGNYANGDWRQVEDDNLYSSWLLGFGQLLVFAGIGFILYDVAAKGANKEKEPKETPQLPSSES